ncbi:hypothetical protein LMG28727_07226 [Paraburkholderia kirstenboschensis]|uniref:branched-chain amino acid ABC transporter permease n=1 Tax=Paraburkholderia kirstenboschensis TaxID=1245436 RepID=UPI000B0A1579|nr:branched-chain amino acid ABC transporter permease [Paraburkholderia kirstenboschensis]CAD6560668.1 hypothetical protein LMG28727_07226 [Paraburkholderia kirstenboschensis]
MNYAIKRRRLIQAISAGLASNLVGLPTMAAQRTVKIGIVSPAFVKQFGSSNEARQMTIYYRVLGTTLATLVGIYAVMRSRIGLAFSAMRDNEEGVVTAGVNLPFARSLSYLIVSPFVGMVGVLVTLQTLRISHLSSFSMMDWTIFVLSVTVIGGIGSLEGPILGTVVFFLLRHFLQDLGVWYLIALGSLAVVVILIEPRGLWGLLRNHLSDDSIPLRHRAVVLSFKTEKETLNAN